MKKQTKFTGFIKLLIACFVLLAIGSHAQCNFKIENQLGCSIKVNVVVYTNSASGCNLACNTSQSGIIISSNATYNILCTGCGVVCNIEVTVTDMNGSPITTPVTASFTSGAQSLPGLNTAPCNAVSGGFVYDSTNRIFKVD